MTTHNSVQATVPTPASVVQPSRLDALASAFDVQDPPYQFATVAESVTPAPVTAPAQPAPAFVPPQGQPAPSAAPQPAPVTPKHPAWLIAQATELGIHPLLLDRLDTNELGQFVYDQNTLIRQNAAAQSRGAAVTNPNPPGGTPHEVAAAATQTAPPPPQSQAREFDWGEFQEYDEYGRPVAGKKKKYTDEDVNPALAHHIKKLTDEVQGLKSFIGTMQNQAIASSEKKFENEFDAAFSNYPAVFGAGSAAQVKGQPEFFERRKLVFGAAKAMMKSLPPELAGKMTIATAVATMAKSMFGVDPVAAAATPATPAGSPAPDYTNAGVARPTQRQPSSKPLGVERAEEAVKHWWQEQSANGKPVEGDTTVDEFL